jgi:hypothetical protein
MQSINKRRATCFLEMSSASRRDPGSIEEGERLRAQHGGKCAVTALFRSALPREFTVNNVRHCRPRCSARCAHGDC